MPATTERHPVLARDVARSYISICIAFAAVIGIFYALIFLTPSVFRGLDVGQLIRLFYYASWTLFCLIYIVLSLIAYLRLDAETLRSSTAATDPGTNGWRRFWWALNGGGAISWALTGTGVTLFALVVEATQSAGELPLVVLIACITVVVTTVALIIVSFAVNYARENSVYGGLVFPGDDPPRFGDYIYFAVQCTTTFGGSDVEVTRRRMRRIVSMHSLIAFGFNTVIVALLVSVLVGRLG